MIHFWFINVDIQYPITCCQLDSKFSLRYSSCPNYFTESNSFIQIGCWDKLNDLILLIRHAMILVIVGKIGILVSNNKIIQMNPFCDQMFNCHMVA